MAKGLGQYKEGYGAAKTLSSMAAKPQKVAARQSKRQGMRANRKIYGALDRTFQDIADDSQAAYGQLGRQYHRGLSGLTGMMNFGGGLVGAAGGDAFGGIAASGARGLADRKSADIENMSSYRRQGALEQKNNAANLVNAFRQEMERIAAGQAAMTAQMTPQMQGQLWGREQQLWEREQMEAEMARRRELSEWFRRWVKRMEEERGGLGGGPYYSGVGNYTPHKAYGMTPEQYARETSHLTGPGYGGR